jgi:hypothetical protein
MARNKDDARSGWKARRSQGRRRGRRIDTDERAAIRAARAGLTPEETAFNPEVQTAAPAADDFVSALSDADLAALYKQLHDGRAPAPKAKRVTIERAVRAKQAEQAAVQELPEPEYIDQAERPDDEDGEIIEGDDQ